MRRGWTLPVSPQVWGTLFLGALALAGVSFVFWRVFGQMNAALGSESPFGSGAFAAVGVGGLVAAALLWLARPRRAVSVAAVMACGGAMTEASFARGASYGYCSRRCVHSRADFEARRAAS